MAFFPLRQFEQSASSRKEVMRAGSDNAPQIKCVVKGKCSNQKESKTEFWDAWQRQQFLFSCRGEAAFRILCMTWGLTYMETVISHFFLLNLKNLMSWEDEKNMSKCLKFKKVWSNLTFFFLLFLCPSLGTPQHLVLGTSCMAITEITSCETT